MGGVLAYSVMHQRSVLWSILCGRAPDSLSQRSGWRGPGSWLHVRSGLQRNWLHRRQLLSAAVPQAATRKIKNRFCCTIPFCTPILKCKPSSVSSYDRYGSVAPSKEAPKFHQNTPQTDPNCFPNLPNGVPNGP